VWGDRRIVAGCFFLSLKGVEIAPVERLLFVLGVPGDEGAVFFVEGDLGGDAAAPSVKVD
jgi:hypothetical protein